MRQKKIVIKNANSSSLNLQIAKKLAELQKFEIKYREEHGTFELENFNLLTTDNMQVDFIEFCETELEKSDLSPGTKQHHRSYLNNLKEFRKRIMIKNINYKFIVDYDFYLREKDLHINTVTNHHKKLHSYLEKAINLDLIPKNPYRKFKIKTVESNREAISETEIKQIENTEIADKTIDLVKDMFLFSCYTGLIYSDIQNLKIEDIDDDFNLKIRQEKTKKHLILPIKMLFNGKPIDIIDKYK